MKEFEKSIKNNSKTKYYKNKQIGNKPWLDSDLKLELKKRKELLNLKKNNPNSDTFKKEFIKQKNRVKTKIIGKKRTFFDSKFIDSINNPKKFWNNINELIYNKNRKKMSLQK